MNGNIGYRRQNSPDEKEKIVEATCLYFDAIDDGILPSGHTLGLSFTPSA